MKKISALINYYNDLAFLRLLDECGQLDIYDEIVLVDGPYEYVREHPFLGLTTCYLDDYNWGRDFIARKEIKYIKNIWKNEEEKRVSAYETCSHNIVVLHDTDEFYKFDEIELDTFLKSDKGVAFFVCQNLCLDGYHFSKEIVTNIKNFPLKAFIFKKDLIDSSSHLDYLWLVGVKQNEKNLNMLYMQPVALGYHFTQMRDLAGQTQKFSFYTSLYGSIHSDLNKKSQIINSLTKLVTDKALSGDDAQAIYLRGNPAFSGLMRPDDGYITQQRVIFSDCLEAVCETISKRRYRFKSNAVYKLVNGWPCYFILEKDITVFNITSAFIEKISVKQTVLKINIKDNSPEQCISTIPGQYRFSKEADFAGRLIEMIYRSGNELVDDYIPIETLISFE